MVKVFGCALRMERLFELFLLQFTKIKKRVRQPGRRQRPKNYSNNFLLTRLDAMSEAIKPSEMIVAITIRTF